MNRKATMSPTFTLRRKSELPFYCKPISLFLCGWLMMLALFQLHFSVNSYPDSSLALLLFMLSFASLLIGYFTVKAATVCLGRAPRTARPYRVNLTRLRRVQWCLIAAATVVILLNLATEGKPPIFGFLGADTLNYVEYGELKQLLIAATMALFVSGSFETSNKRKFLVYSFALLCPLAYALRGFLLMTLCQGLFVYSLRTRVKKKTLYLVAGGTFLTAMLIANFIGNGRSEGTQELFVGFFGIRRVYADWPMTALWIISYVATPLSDMCWIIHSYKYTNPTATFMTTMLPSFWAVPVLEVGDLGSDSIIDAVHTYLAKYYLDLWYFGIFLINYVWGLIAGYLSGGDRMARRSLTSSVLLTAMAFMFFVDYLTVLTVVAELAILHFIQGYVTEEVVGR